jgi:hypothetical protein
LDFPRVGDIAHEEYPPPAERSNTITDFLQFVACSTQ